MADLANFPRTFASMEDLQGGLLTLLFVLGPIGRDTIKGHLLANAAKPEMRSLLKVINDFERVLEWRDTHPDATRVP